MRSEVKLVVIYKGDNLSRITQMVQCKAVPFVVTVQIDHKPPSIMLLPAKYPMYMLLTWRINGMIHWHALRSLQHFNKFSRTID